jgi:hypothetical protein
MLEKAKSTLQQIEIACRLLKDENGKYIVTDANHLSSILLAVFSNIKPNKLDELDIDYIISQLSGIE